MSINLVIEDIRPMSFRRKDTYAAPMFPLHERPPAGRNAVEWSFYLKPLYQPCHTRIAPLFVNPTPERRFRHTLIDTSSPACNRVRCTTFIVVRSRAQPKGERLSEHAVQRLSSCLGQYVSFNVEHCRSGLSIGGLACKGCGVCMVRAKFILGLRLTTTACKSEAR